MNGLIVEKKLTDRRDSIIFRGISSPIEHRRHTKRGEPWAVWRHERPLTNRQRRLLDSLPSTGSRVIVRKSAASMSDLAALTAETGNEFAMFTCGHRRLIVRGDDGHVDVDRAEAERLVARGYRWSGHTHPKGGLFPSDSDKKILACFVQKMSVIYNAEGKFYTFTSFR